MGGHRPVTVVVDAIAQLGSAVVDADGGVVAVALTASLAIAVGVELVGGKRASTAVVETVAQLGGTRVDRVVRVVAVVDAAEGTITVAVDTLAGGPHHRLL